MNREELARSSTSTPKRTRPSSSRRWLVGFFQKEAKRRLAEATNKYDVPEFKVIDTVPDRNPWRIEGLISTGAYVMISAQKKAGKTTLGLNLVRALINGGMFLGKFRTFGQSKVGLVDLGSLEFHLADWLRKCGLLGDDRLVTMPLRGRAKSLGILDEDRREQFVHQLQDNAVDVLIIDPLGPLLRAYGIDEKDNTLVGQVVDLINEATQDAGVSELIIMHHHGKDDSLGARGASVLGNTPTSLWSLRRTTGLGCAACRSSAERATTCRSGWPSTPTPRPLSIWKATTCGRRRTTRRRCSTSWQPLWSR